MHDLSDASEREPYQRVLAALFEVAQALLTLQTVATVDAQNLQTLVVENITALLDDLQQGHHPSQQLINRQVFDLRLAFPPAAEIDSEYRSDYRRLDKAVLQVKDAFRRLEPVKIDALAAETRSNLNNAISSTKDAFWQIARSEGTPDPALLVALGRMRTAITVFSGDVDRLGRERTLGTPDDAAPTRVAVLDSRPRLRRSRSVADDTRQALHRPSRNSPRRGTDPFDR